MNLEEKILKYNRQIQEDEKQKAIVEDKIKSIVEKLKEDYDLEEKDISSIIDKLKNDCSNLNDEIESDLEQLEKNYTWE